MSSHGMSVPAERTVPPTPREALCLISTCAVNGFRLGKFTPSLLVVQGPWKGVRKRLFLPHPHFSSMVRRSQANPSFVVRESQIIQFSTVAFSRILPFSGL